jgi:hypothetical protein
MPKNRLQPVRPTVGAAELTRPSTDATRQKQELFVAALEQAFDLIQSTLSDGADSSADQTPDGVLSAMGATYATLISNRDLLMLQVHALSVVDVPEIGRPFARGFKRSPSS